MRTATLIVDRSCRCCWKFRLIDGAGRVVWSNRVMPEPRGEAGARRRLAAWALAHGYRVVEARKEVPAEKRRA